MSPRKCAPSLRRVGGATTIVGSFAAPRGARLACSHVGTKMLSKLRTFSLRGIEAVPVEVEVDVSPSGLPKTVLVGLPEAAVKESEHRVGRALVNSGFCARTIGW